MLAIMEERIEMPFQRQYAVARYLSGRHRYKIGFNVSLIILGVSYLESQRVGP